MKNPSWTQYSKIVALMVFVCSGADATIENVSASDTRGMSLGGASSASVDDAAAGLVNPAVLGFMARPGESDVDNNGLGEHNFGWNIIDFGVDATLTGELGDYLEVLGKIDFDNFDTDQLKKPENISKLLSLAGALGNVSDDDTIVVNASVGTAAQIGHFGIGVRSFGQVGGWINNLDLVKIGLAGAASVIADELREALGSDPGPLSGGTLTNDQLEQLRDAFGGSIANEDVVNYIDSKVTELVENGTIDPGQIKGAIDTLATILENSDGVNNLLSDNRTSITGRAFAAVEIPVSYGYAFNDNFSLGVTAKAIFGRVYGTQVWVFNEDNTEILTDSLDNSSDSATVGLDLGMMYRIPKIQFALVGHNLNSPRFDGYDQTVMLNGEPEMIRVPDVVLDPQITLGAAWFPAKRFMLSSDFELLETGTILNNYDVQRLSFGTEVDLSLLALRLGTYKNLAESDFGWVLTGGVGFNLWALSIDLGAAISIDDTVEYDGTEYPRTARFHAGVGLTF